MNNSKLALDEVGLSLEEKPDVQEKLQERQAKLLRIIEALQGIMQTEEWSSLKTEVFDGLPEQIRKDLLSESRKDDPDPKKLNRLSGELKWAEKFSDLSKLENQYRVELQGIRLQLHGKTESNGGNARD